jgi:hypothetical protein
VTDKPARPAPKVGAGVCDLLRRFKTEEGLADCYAAELWGANTGPGSIRRVYSIDKSPGRRSCWNDGGGGVRCCGCWS